MREIIRVLKNNRGGVSQFVAAVVSMLAIIMIFLALTAGLRAYNEYGTLNDFGSQLAATAGSTGRCSGDRLTARYNELVQATGLTPEAEYAANYFNADTRTVQYGDTITLTLTWNTRLSAVGISIPITLHVTKSVESQQYWK